MWVMILFMVSIHNELRIRPSYHFWRNHRAPCRFSSWLRLRWQWRMCARRYFCFPLPRRPKSCSSEKLRPWDHAPRTDPYSSPPTLSTLVPVPSKVSKWQAGVVIISSEAPLGSMPRRTLWWQSSLTLVWVTACKLSTLTTQFWTLIFQDWPNQLCSAERNGSNKRKYHDKMTWYCIYNWSNFIICLEILPRFEWDQGSIFWTAGKIGCFDEQNAPHQELTSHR